MAVKQLKDGRWTVYYRDETGKQRWEYFGRGRSGQEDAEARDYDIKARKKRRQALTEDPGQATLPEICQAYLDHLKASGASPKFRKELSELLKNHILPLIGTIPPDHINDADIARVVDYYRNRDNPASQATINRYLRYLRTIFRFGISREMMSKNPLASWRKPKEAPRRLQLTVADLQKLIEHAAPHLAWGLEVLWNLGCRPGTSELTSIKWDQVDWDKGKVWIWGRKTQTWRDVPVSVAFLERLREKHGQARTEYVIEYAGRPVKKFRSSVKTAAKNAGLHQVLCLYEVRHLFATTMLTGGGDLAAVSRLLGHASTHMTADVYYGYLQGEKEKAVNLLPDIGPRGQSKDNPKVVNLNDWRKKGK